MTKVTSQIVTTEQPPILVPQLPKKERITTLNLTDEEVWLLRLAICSVYVPGKTGRANDQLSHLLDEMLKSNRINDYGHLMVGQAKKTLDELLLGYDSKSYDQIMSYAGVGKKTLG